MQSLSLQKQITHSGNSSKNRIEIDEDDWDVSCKIVDRVLKIVVCEMREAANKRFPGLALLGTLKKRGFKGGFKGL